MTAKNIVNKTISELMYMFDPVFDALPNEQIKHKSYDDLFCEWLNKLLNEMEA